MQPYENAAVVMHVVRQILPIREPLTIERVLEGQSTVVYRICGNDAIFYLRVLPEQDASFAPEVYIHSVLRAWHVQVPDVVYFEHHNATLQRSVMLTTAIAGQAIGYSTRPAQVHQIVRQAGRQLARINSLNVRGFGWVQRTTNVVDGIYAEYPTYRDWMIQHFDAPLMVLRQSHVLAPRDSRAIRMLMTEAVTLFGGEPAVLAHGDFDATHIYYHEGHYTGIIDFGEIRGAHPLYDIGHFWIENSDLLPSLLEGYTEVVALPPDYWRRIYLTGLLIAARRLGRRLAKQVGVYQPDVQAIQRALRAVHE